MLRTQVGKGALEPGVTRGDRTPRNRGLSGALFGIPILVALVIGAVFCTHIGLSEDEYSTLAIASEHGRLFLDGLARDGGNMCGYYLFMHVLVGVAGSSVALVRAVSVIAMAALAGTLVALGLVLFDSRRVALFAGLLGATSPALLPYALLARGYAPMLLFSTLSYLALVSLLACDRAAGRRWRALGYGLSVLAAVYCGFEIVLVLVPQVALLLVRRERARDALVALGVVAVLSVPVMVLAANRGSGQLYWVPDGRLGLQFELLNVVTAQLVGALPSPVPGGDGLGALLALAVIAALLRRRSGPQSVAAALVLGWFVAPILISFTASLAGVPVELGHFALMACPALAIGLAVLLSDLRRHALIPTVLVLAALHGVGIGDDVSHQLPLNGVRTTVSQVVSRSGPSSCIVFYQQGERQHFDYWLLRDPREALLAQRRLTPLLPDAPWSEIRSYVEEDAVLSPTEIAAASTRCRTLFFWYGRIGDSPVQAVRARAARGRAFLAAVARDYRRARPLVTGSSITVFTDPER